MKKTLFSLLSATALLWSTSCSEDKFAPVSDNAMVQFNVELSEQTGSRSTKSAIESGVTELYYEVYAHSKQGVDENPLVQFDKKVELGSSEE